MSSCFATQRASSALLAPSRATATPVRKKTPDTSWPASRSRAAARLESTPPERQTTTRWGWSFMMGAY